VSKKLEFGLRELANLIKGQENFVLGAHIMPDGDALGSLLGLGFLLKNLDKKVCIGWPKATKLPPQYSFLPGVELRQKIEKPPFNEGNFIFIALDCSSPDRLGSLEEIVSKAKQVVNIDHHPRNTQFGTLNLVDERAPATSELVFRLSRVLKSELNKNIATCLYTGLVTDTGRFQYSNTGERAFEMAQELLKFGLSPTYIFQRVYENISFGNLKLLGQVLEDAQYLPRIGLVYSQVTQEKLSATGAQMEETEHFIDYLRSAKEARIAVIFKEMPNNSLRVSLRSKDNVNVGEVAQKFGGGGHKHAAAFTSNKKMDASLKNLIETLEQAKNVVKG